MLKTTTFKSAKLQYSDQGSGAAIVLLHGYLESMEIWNDFAPELAKTNRVICIDIPGHGQSGIIAAYHTMELMAEAVIEVLNELQIEKSYVVGHSMGGYITMSLVSNFPDRLLGFCLLHSTPFGDTEEKKENRDREIEMIRNGKKELIANTNIPRGFANDNLATFPETVEHAITLGKLTPDEGIIALLNGMRDRLDRTAILQHTKLPHLWVLGKKDNYIVWDVIESKLNLLGGKGDSLILENSGHMGFIEEKESVLQKLVSFCSE